jgi:cation-transporting ATPase E
MSIEQSQTLSASHTAQANPPPLLPGLSDAEVQERVARGQRNLFVHKSARSTWEIIRDNVFTVFNIVLFVTLVATMTVGLATPGMHQTIIGDTIFSGGTVWLNMIIGIIQELMAKRQLDQLAALAVRNARVRRNGKSVEIPADEIVLDDIVEIGPGDRVPVDGELVETHALEMDESLLTGESDSLAKAEGDAAYSGSFCLVGNGALRATKVGADSYANKLTLTARATKDNRTPLQRKIDLVVQGLVVVMVIVAALEMVAAVNMRIQPVFALRQTLVIVTSFVPAGLILAITVSLSVGAVRIGRLGALVQRVNAIESMGNVTVLCTDKTGTLTRNLLSVQQVIPLGNYTDIQVRQMLAEYVGNLNSQNKTAGAIATWVGGEAQRRVVKAEIPFSSARKWSALTFACDGEDCESFILGSPEILFDHSHSDALARVGEFTRLGLRVVALMRTHEPLPADDIPSALHTLKTKDPLALIVIRDEIRTDIQDTLRAFEQQGVRIKVISGDNAETVQAIARQSGLQGDKVVTERELQSLADNAFDSAVETADLFARITPETKQRIVASLSGRGEYVAMVGDGVNDVPAIKQARLGIAMNDGAQITKDVSALVLLENTMSTLPQALSEGRRITQKILASAKLYLAKNFVTIFAILFAGFVGLPFPGEPRQISWVASISVGVPCTLLAFGLLTPSYTRSFLGGVLGYSLLSGAIGSIVVVIAYIASNYIVYEPQQARTVFAFANLHYAMHVFWDAHGVSVFSPSSMRKHPRETLAGLLLLVVGFLGPVIVPGLFSSRVPDLAEWVLIIVLPLLGSFTLRSIIYGASTRHLVNVLKA